MTRIEMMRRKINECLSENLMTNVTFEITSEVYSDSEEFTVVFAMGQYRATLLVTCTDTNTWVYHSYIGHCACSGSKYYRSIISVFRQMVNDIDDYKEMWEVVTGTTETTETVESKEIKEATEDCSEYDEILDRKDSTDRDRINHLMKTHSFPLISGMYNDKCFCCPANRIGNRCCGEKWCAETWKRYEAIIKPEWHHVSLTTLANLDFDMLDEKRQIYLSAYRDLKQTLSYLRKCKTQDTYDKCFIRYIRRKSMLWVEGKISDAMRKYIERHLSMQNVESGVLASKCEDATGHHESRRYNKTRAWRS